MTSDEGHLMSRTQEDPLEPETEFKDLGHLAEHMFHIFTLTIDMTQGHQHLRKHQLSNMWKMT